MMHNYIINTDAVDVMTTISACLIFIFLALCIYTLVVRVKLFEKMGISGWKAIVPVYGDFVLYDVVVGGYSKWIYVVAIIISTCTAMSFTDVGIFISMIASIMLFVLQIQLMHCIAISFGKQDGWTVGLIFLYPIFAGILAFSSKENYVTPDELNVKSNTNTPKCEVAEDKYNKEDTVDEENRIN